MISPGEVNVIFRNFLTFSVMVTLLRRSVENPDENCPYYTNKQGFMNHTASRHIIEVHKLKAKEMQPGQCKFKKVKVERD